MRRRLDALKAVAEPMRWRIVELLAAEELCVCHLVEELDVPQPLVSHHLRVLRDAGLVDDANGTGTGPTTGSAPTPSPPSAHALVAPRRHARRRRRAPPAVLLMR